MSDPASTHGLWADLARPHISPADADISVIGIPFDGLASVRRGATRGPERIRFWSGPLTPDSEDRTRLAGMTVCDPGDINTSRPESDFERVRQKVASPPNIPILLGGDHSVTIPILQGKRECFAGKRIGVPWVDAHPDLCDNFDGSRTRSPLQRTLLCLAGDFSPPAI